MDLKPQYLVNGRLIRGYPTTNEREDPALRKMIDGIIAGLRITIEQVLVLRDAEIVMEGVVYEMEVMVIPHAHIAGVCLPPYNVLTLPQDLRKAGVSQQEIQEHLKMD